MPRPRGTSREEETLNSLLSEKRMAEQKLDDPDGMNGDGMVKEAE